jgi:hypothetical protein
VPKTKW